jgi:hypothetical protein
MPPLGFTDEEMDLLSALASALPPAVREGFLQLVAGKLAAYAAEARGSGLLHRPGLLHRLAAESQCDFLKIVVGGGAKYRPNYLRGERR